jgi:hypothetical protein
MRSQTICRLTLVLAAAFMLGSTLFAQSIASDGFNRPPAKTLKIVINGTLGPVLSGSDPLGADGQGGKLTVKASESLSPKKHTSNSATYVLPAGAMTITVGSQQFKTTSSSTMAVKLTTQADILTLSATGPQGIQITGTAYLATGSWTSAVLKHPAPFLPSPQKLTPAKSDTGPGSKLKYTIFGSSTVLGITGKASSSDAADLFFPGEGLTF